MLSPRLFCAVLEFAMSSWRAKVETYGLNLHDGMKALLDQRFADDLLVFATSRDDTIRLLEESFNFCGPSWLETLSHTCLEQHWKLAHYAVNLLSDRWLPRLLHWKPVGQRRVGRPRQQWDDMLRTFCRYKRLGEWELAARDGRNWETLMPDFIFFCSGS